MNDETKKSLIRLGFKDLAKLSMQEFLEYSKQLAEEQEAERRKNDPKFVKRYEASHNGIVESDLGLYVLYEDFVRFVKILEEKVSKAYEDGRSVGSDRSCSWRD